VRSAYTAFLVRLTLVAILAWAAYMLLRGEIPPKFAYPRTGLVLLFFYVVTAVFHYGLLRSEQRGNRNIIHYYMLSTVLKLLLFIAIIMGYSLAYRQENIPFVLHFFGSYVVFTVFEVLTVSRYFRSKTGGSTTGNTAS
jgi:hypothetical protein